MVIKNPMAPLTERRYKRQADGLYHVKGKTYQTLVGRRSQVGQGHAYKTSGGLTIDDLVMNTSGEWVSKKKSITGKKEMRLLKHGYGFKENTFGSVKVTPEKAEELKKTLERTKTQPNKSAPYTLKTPLKMAQLAKKRTFKASKVIPQ
jgi:hypothetical protein